MAWPTVVDVRTYVRHYDGMNATQLRADLYTVLDSILETGRPVIIERKGQKLRLALDCEEAPRRRARKWPKPDPSCMSGHPDDILEIDWSKEWKP